MSYVYTFATEKWQESTVLTGSFGKWLSTYSELYVFPFPLFHYFSKLKKEGG